MIDFSKVSVTGWEEAARGMRNPLNSWKLGDTRGSDVGPNDMRLMTSLSKAGSDHAKYKRMIQVYVDITAPFYWWKQFDTYKIGTVANSCSTMHMLTAKEFGLEDFSYEWCNDKDSMDILKATIEVINKKRKICKDPNATNDEKREAWYSIVQLLPEGYNQKRTVMLNYEVLSRMYKSRKNHKLAEWNVFCKWVETLPHSGLITD